MSRVEEVAAGGEDRWRCLGCGEEFGHPRGEEPPACPNPNCGRKGPLKPLTGPFTYFERKRFLPKKLADEIMQEHRFATHRESWVVYRYADGCYLPDGEALIREECRKRLGKLATEHYVSEVVAHIRDTTFRRPEDFDPPPHLLCLENGVLDLRTRELRPHTPDMIFLQKVPVRYDPRARCPAVGRRLQEWTTAKNVVRLVQFAGFCLYRSYFIRKALVLFGRGKNGKTTFILFLTRWLGERNVAAVSVLELSESSFARAHLFGKMANLCDELPPATWFETEGFKSLTGGGWTSAERKFRDPFEFRNYAKILFAANELPAVRDESRAFWDRIMIADFPNVFEGERQLGQEEILKEMLTGEERSGFLNAALVGLEMLLRFGEFFGQEEVERVREAYFDRSSPVGAFAHRHIVPCEDGIITKDELYQRFVEFCRRRGTSAVDKAAFAKALMRLEPAARPAQRRIGGEVTRVWVGIRYVEEPEQEAEGKEGAGEEGLGKLFPYTQVDFNPTPEELVYIKRIARAFRSPQGEGVTGVTGVTGSPYIPCTGGEFGAVERIERPPATPVTPATPTAGEGGETRGPLGEGEVAEERVYTVTFLQDYPGGLVPGVPEPAPRGTKLVLPASRAFELRRKFGFVGLEEHREGIQGDRGEGVELPQKPRGTGSRRGTEKAELAGGV